MEAFTFKGRSGANRGIPLRIPNGLAADETRGSWLYSFRLTSTATGTLSLPKISSACRHSLLEKLIKATVQQRCNGVLDRKAGSADENPARLATRLLWFIRRTEAIVAEDRLKLSGVALVAMVKSSDLRNHYDAPAFWLLHGSRFRSIFGQRQMSSGVLVVGKITSQSPAQRSFIPHDDVV
jgi:hypothetical protein